MLWKNDESGQASVEYMLLLATSVVLVVLIYKNFLSPTFSQVGAAIQNKLNTALFGGDMSTFPLSK